MITLNDLIAEYAQWNKAQGLSLGSADEHLFDESLTDEQRSYLRDFSRRWEEVQAEEHVTVDDIDVTQAFDNIVNLAWEAAKRTEIPSRKPITVSEIRAIMDSIAIELTNVKELLS